MKITELKTDPRVYAWSVESDSGNTYTVRHKTKLDEMGSMYFVWECNCPARKTCKHIDAVADECQAADDQADERDEV